MKKIKKLVVGAILFFLVLSSKYANSQIIPVRDFGSINLGDFSYTEFNTKDLAQFPYLDIGLIVQNTRYLSDQNFIKRFQGVTHFYTEIKARYNEQTFSVPIVLMQKERRDRGVFSSINDISNKVFEKFQSLKTQTFHQISLFRM